MIRSSICIYIYTYIYIYIYVYIRSHFGSSGSNGKACKAALSSIPFAMALWDEADEPCAQRVWRLYSLRDELVDLVSTLQREECQALAAGARSAVRAGRLHRSYLRELVNIDLASNVVRHLTAQKLESLRSRYRTMLTADGSMAGNPTARPARRATYTAKAAPGPFADTSEDGDPSEANQVISLFLNNLDTSEVQDIRTRAISADIAAGTAKNAFVSDHSDFVPTESDDGKFHHQELRPLHHRGASSSGLGAPRNTAGFVAWSVTPVYSPSDLGDYSNETGDSVFCTSEILAPPASVVPEAIGLASSLSVSPPVAFTSSVWVSAPELVKQLQYDQRMIADPIVPEDFRTEIKGHSDLLRASYTRFFGKQPTAEADLALGSDEDPQTLSMPVIA